MNSREYRKISEFECCGKDMVVVRGANSCHVMTVAEWKKIYRRNHLDRWKNGTRVRKNQKIA